MGFLCPFMKYPSCEHGVEHHDRYDEFGNDLELSFPFVAFAQVHELKRAETQHSERVRSDHGIALMRDVRGTHERFGHRFGKGRE